MIHPSSWDGNPEAQKREGLIQARSHKKHRYRALLGIQALGCLNPPYHAICPLQSRLLKPVGWSKSRKKGPMTQCISSASGGGVGGREAVLSGRWGHDSLSKTALKTNTFHFLSWQYLVLASIWPVAGMYLDEPKENNLFFLISPLGSNTG